MWHVLKTNNTTRIIWRPERRTEYHTRTNWHKKASRAPKIDFPLAIWGETFHSRKELSKINKRYFLDERQQENQENIFVQEPTIIIIWCQHFLCGQSSYDAKIWCVTNHHLVQLSLLVLIFTVWPVIIWFQYFFVLPIIVLCQYLPCCQWDHHIVQIICYNTNILPCSQSLSGVNYLFWC